MLCRTRLAVLSFLCCTVLTAAAVPDPAGLKQAVALFQATTDPKTDLAALAVANTSNASAHPADPFVQKLAALTSGRLAERAANYPTRLALLHAGLNHVAAMQANDTEAGQYRPDVLIMVNNAPTDLNLKDGLDLEKQFLSTIFDTERLSGLLIPEHQPLPAGVAPPPFSPQAWNAGFAAYVYLEKKDCAGAFNLLDRLIAAGEAELAQNPRYEVTSAVSKLYANRCKALIAAAKRAPQAASSLDRLIQAGKDSDRFLALMGKHDLLFWPQSDEQKLRRLIESVQAARQRALDEPRSLAMQPDDWFTAEEVGKGPAHLAMIRALSAAWAVDLTAGGLATRSRSYLALRKDTQARADRSPNRKAANHAFALAAREHAEIEAARPGAAFISKVPDFLWEFIDPTVKPRSKITDP